MFFFSIASITVELKMVGTGQGFGSVFNMAVELMEIESVDLEADARDGGVAK